MKLRLCLPCTFGDTVRVTIRRYECRQSSPVGDVAKNVLEERLYGVDALPRLDIILDSDMDAECVPVSAQRRTTTV